MSTVYKRFFLGAIFLAVIAASFFLGHWRGTLKASLAHEASYPWELHKKLSKIDVKCAMPPTVGAFFVQPADAGETLLIASLNHQNNTANAFAINSNGQLASDSWAIDCKQ